MEAYLPDGVNREDPRLSPMYAPADAYPPVTIIVRMQPVTDTGTKG